MRNIKLEIAIPSNTLEDCNDLRSKTIKLGQVARAAAIFKVNEIYIYSLNKLNAKRYEKDIQLMKKILEYLDCPQYLRKICFAKEPNLRYVGMLPPLRTPHHPRERTVAELKPISFRDGVILGSSNNSSEIEVGLENTIKIAKPHLPIKSRITVKIIKKKHEISAMLANKAQIKDYWGYEINVVTDSLKTLLKKSRDCLIIATSKRGNPLWIESGELPKKLRTKKKILLLFGSPKQGLYEIAKINNFTLTDWVDLVINIAPTQGTETIRVEEAVISTLALINSIIYPRTGDREGAPYSIIK
ncbi:MAG: putative RNA uridine N3 methyltransferase [Candidatus Helarchaeota archaeon]